MSLGLAAAAGGEPDPATIPADPAEPVEPAPVVAPPLLGASHAALRERFGEALRRVEIAAADSPIEQILEIARPSPDPADPDEPAVALTRWGRSAGGDVAQVEYDLFEGRVYRVRWRLSERFEQPLMDDVVARTSERLGRPDYDQTLHAKPGSPRADLRRSGWTLEGRALEIRQLHPFTGGPVYLSVADRGALQAIVDAKAAPLPQPDATGAWWRRPQRPPSLLPKAEREARVAAIDALVAQLVEAPR